MKNIKMTALFVIACMIVLPSTLSAELSGAHFEIIKIAYTNGYVNAISSDINTIQALKVDKNKLRQFSSRAVDNYMERVTILNLDNRVKKKKKKSDYSGSNMMTL
jgi:hypothetical protein